MDQPANTANQKMTRLTLLAVVAGLLLTLHLSSPPQRGLWAQVFFNSLHVPVFGLIAVSLYAAIPDRRGYQRIILAFVATAVLSVLSEAAQINSARDASFNDLIADWFGAAGFLFVVAAVSGRYSDTRGKRILTSFLAITLLGWSLFPLAKVSAAYIDRNSHVPLLVNFNSAGGDLFIRKQNIDFQIIGLPDDHRKIARIKFGAGPWPGVAFHDVWPDWRDFSNLIIELSIEGSEALEFNVRVHDQAHRQYNQAHTDRFNGNFTLEPGKHTLQILLEDIRQAPRDRQMDMSRIEEIIVFCRASSIDRTIHLYEIRLQ